MDLNQMLKNIKDEEKEKSKKMANGIKETILKKQEQINKNTNNNLELKQNTEKKTISREVNYL
tara:strand:+ start:1105 stop:1293 length:189 start_codon:yes stop_codon:yes gene_type:complete